MKRFYILITLCLLFINVKAQSAEEMKFRQLIDVFNNAIIRTDTSVLNNMVHKQLSYAHSSGLIQDKNAFIKAIMAGPNFFKSFDLRDQTVAIVGKNAIVRHIATAQAINNGNPVEIKFGNLMVWQKNRGSWKLIARQGYKL